LGSLVAKEFARSIEPEEASIGTEKPIRAKPKRQLAETLPLEKVAV